MNIKNKALVLILTLSLLVTAIFPCGISLAYTHEFHYRVTSKTDYVGSITDSSGNPITGVVTMQDFVNWCNTSFDNYDCLITMHGPYNVMGDEVWEVEDGSQLTLINNQTGTENYPAIVLSEKRPSHSLALKGSIMCDNFDNPHWFIDIRANCTVNMYDGVTIKNAYRPDDTSGTAAGICLYSNATFNMYGGTITENYLFGSTANSSAVWFSGTNATFNMYGGSITGNANDNNRGAVFFEESGTLNIGASASINGNTGHNIHLKSGRTIGVMSALTADSKFYLENIAVGDTVARGVESYTLSSDDLARLTCENLPDYAYLKLDTSDNRIYVERRIVSYTVQTYFETLGGGYSSTSSSGTYGAALVYSITPAATATYGGYNYTYDSANTNNVTSITMSATNPSLNVLKLYYKLNSVNFEVNYYYELPSGGYSAVPYVAETGVGLPGDAIERTHPATWSHNSLNYVYDSENAGNVSSITLVSGTKGQLKAYYKLAEVSYTVRSYFMLTDGTYSSTPDLIGTPVAGKNGTSVTITPAAYDNFTVDTDASTLSLTLSTDLTENVFNVYYQRKTVNYTVETYMMGIDETYPTTPTSTQTLSDYIERAIAHTPSATLTSGIYTYALDTAASTLSVTLSNETNTIKVYYALSLGNLTVTVDNASNESQSFVFTVSGDIGTFDVTVIGNSSTTITGLPVGDYTVMPKNDWSWRYTAASAKNVSINILPGNVRDNASAVFSNGQSVLKWLSVLANSIFKG